MKKAMPYIGGIFILAGVVGLIYMIVVIIRGGSAQPFTGLGVPALVLIACGLYLMRDRLGIFQPKDPDPSA